MADITISVNGESMDAPLHTTIADLVVIMALQDKRIAVELNEEIVPRSRHAEVELKANDIVEVVTAIGGG